MKMLRGAVYLLQDADTGEYRVGASKAPRSRILDHRRAGLRLMLTHVIRCNDCFRLESYVLAAWKTWAVGGDWFRLPADQVAWFCGFGVVNYHGLDPVEAFAGDEVDDMTSNAPPDDGRPRLYVVRPGSLVG